ncbi:Segregation and condensation protein B [Acaryochloris thomasi RCC1774]|uniref:Segregation and condensation protein B n=1 Tax=Acaryochloris thomasi RCC1774 TaxID=1764569 RepID=A0A2W1JQV8_9CYAN|nr:SMC-Scp complex subunit ScpB [Acaryochloris thomasi]PZD72484.1 Segregation and condensation protein B [Acaryochloris thomasi RCC1774]
MSSVDSLTDLRLSTKLEAVLYLKSQALTLAKLTEYVGEERDDVEDALIELMQDYAQRDSALEIVETDQGYSLQLRERFNALVQTMIPADLGVGALRTLAAIALKGPILQTDLVDLRGSGVYQHVQELAEQGFVHKRRQANGRSFRLQVSDKFYQYFEVDELPKI